MIFAPLPEAIRSTIRDSPPARNSIQSNRRRSASPSPLPPPQRSGTFHFTSIARKELDNRTILTSTFWFPGERANDTQDANHPQSNPARHHEYNFPRRPACAGATEIRLDEVERCLGEGEGDGGTTTGQQEQATPDGPSQPPKVQEGRNPVHLPG
ncbi:hypothetical protein MLD38_025718 [Melastoma candidum]|uniref:Uncharacterized protein n=1 Tax=Melastoma candidum TaxID=119954 RepID=A0ACB9NWP0_9MYRT|nr:hypothetical protein MLD38_025718 [Melastoma candidum]